MVSTPTEPLTQAITALQKAHSRTPPITIHQAIITHTHSPDTGNHYTEFYH